MLGPAADGKILLAAHQVGYFRNDILLEYALGESLAKSTEN